MNSFYFFIFFLNTCFTILSRAGVFFHNICCPKATHGGKLFFSWNTEYFRAAPVLVENNLCLRSEK